MQKQLDLSPEGTHSMHGLSRFHWFWPAMKTRKLRASKIECCTMVPSHFACRYPVARCRQMSPDVASPFGGEAALTPGQCSGEMRRTRSRLRLPSLQRPSRPGGKPAQCPPKIEQIPTNRPSCGVTIWNCPCHAQFTFVHHIYCPSASLMYWCLTQHGHVQ